MKLWASVVAVLLLLTTEMRAEPNVPGYVVSIYAMVPCPEKLAFDPTGVLYAGAHGAEPMDPARIHRIGPGGSPVTEYGDQLWDPDALVVDVSGVICGTPGSVMVGGQWEHWLNGYVSAIDPNEATQFVWDPGVTILTNPADMQFDSTRLVVLDGSTPRVAVSYAGELPSALITLPTIGLAMAIDAKDRIYVPCGDGNVYLYSPTGELLVTFSTGTTYNIAIGPGGPIWGTDLYFISYPGGDLMRVDLVTRVATQIGTGFTGRFHDLKFGPDGALYAAEDDPSPENGKVYRIYRPRLSLSVEHTEWGSVTVEPNLPYYEPNATVTLTVQKDPTKYWSGWQGDVPPDHEMDNPLTITMDSDKNIITAFKCGFGVGSMLPLTAIGLVGIVALRRRR